MALLGAAALARAAEADAGPPRRAPVQPVRIERPGPRVTLAPEALRSTLHAIVDDSLPLEKRIDAIGLAGLAGLRDAVPVLGRLLRQDDLIEVKVAAVWALGEIGDPAAVPALLQVHADVAGPHPKLRYDETISVLGRELAFIDVIEGAIGRLGATVLGEYLDALHAAGGSYRSADDDRVNRQRSALAVVVCVGDRDHRAVAALIDILKSPKEMHPADFRETAALALARILAARTEEFSVVQARDPLAEEIARLIAEFALDTRSVMAREYIASALNIARPEYAVTLLTEHFADGSPEPVRRRVIEMLGLLRSRESVEALVWALENETSPDLRWRAAFGLGLAGHSELAVDALTRALEDDSATVRRAAIGALGKIGGKQALPRVAPGVEDPDPAIRGATVRALARSGDPAALEPLLKAAEDKDVRVRATAVAALGAIPDRKGLAAVLRAASDEAHQVRFAAVQVLVRVHTPSACAALLGRVTDPDRRIRRDAVNALHLARAKHPEALKKAVLHVMANRDHPAGADACDFADFPDDSDIVGALRKATADPRPEVRAGALRMLDKMNRR